MFEHVNSFGIVILKMSRESRSRSSSRSSSSAGSDIQIVDDETGVQGSDDDMLEVVQVKRIGEDLLRVEEEKERDSLPEVIVINRILNLKDIV